MYKCTDLTKQTDKEQVTFGGGWGETETDGQRQRQSKGHRERDRTGGRW